MALFDFLGGNLSLGAEWLNVSVNPPTPGVVPGVNDDAEIDGEDASSGSITVADVTFDGASSLEAVDITAGNLTVDAGASVLQNSAASDVTGTITVINGSYKLENGDLKAGTGSIAFGAETIGGAAAATFTQTGGANDVAGDLQLGFAGFSSTYTLSGGTLSTLREHLGIDPTGIGTITQTGGANDATYDIIIGTNSNASTNSDDPSGTGIYNLSGTGTVTAGGINVGSEAMSVGTFNFNSDGKDGATVTLSGDPLQPTADYAALVVGGQGEGTFNQGGGTLTFNIDNQNVALEVGRRVTGVGVYNLTGGAIDTGKGQTEIIGYGGAGTFAQTDGTNTVDTLIIGDQDGSVGLYTLHGDEETSLTTKTIDIGVDDGAKGELDFDTKKGDAAALLITATVGQSLIVGDAGTGALSQGADIDLKAGLSLGAQATGVGTYNLNAGDLTTPALADQIVGDAGTGVFLQNNSAAGGGGGNNLAAGGALIIGNQAGGTGTYTLGGDAANMLSAPTIRIGAQQGATGTFNFDPLAADAATLAIPAGGAGLVVGDDGTGTFNQGGPAAAMAANTVNVTSDLQVGAQANGNGTYNLMSGALSTVGGADEIVGNLGTGAFVQNTAMPGGGSNQILGGGGLIVGDGATGKGTYTLGGGPLNTLTTPSIDIGDQKGAVGAFNFDVLPADQGTVVLKAGGAGLTVGDAGAGTLTQGGAGAALPANVINLVSDLEIGAQKTGSGTYFLNAGALNAGAFNEIIGDKGTGQFFQDNAAAGANGSNTIAAGGALEIGNGATGNGLYTLGGVIGNTLTAPTITLGVTQGAVGVLNFDRQAADAASLTAPTALTVGAAGMGTVNQGGAFGFGAPQNAIVLAADLELGAQSTGNGTYNLSAGSLNSAAFNEIVGDLGTGQFVQNTVPFGGTNTLGAASSLIIGNGATGNGTYSLGGNAANVLTAPIITIGAQPGAVGVFNFDPLVADKATMPGTPAIAVGAAGTGTLNQGGPGPGIGAINLGGTLDVGVQASGVGTYNFNAGVLNALAGNNEIIGDQGTGQFIQSNGAAGANAVNTIAAGGALIVGNQKGSDGTYTLGGVATNVLNAPQVGIGNQPGSTGVMNFDVAAGDAAMLNLLAPPPPNGAAELQVGLAGTGTFNQGGGALTLIGNGGAGANPSTGPWPYWDLSLGNLVSGVGTYNLSGGALGAAYGVVGNAGQGTFVQTGGTASFGTKGTAASAQGTTFSLGDQNTGVGHYQISAGSLSVSGNAIIGNLNVGTFQESTATQTTTSVSVSGTMILGDGANAVGTFSTSGSTLSVTGVAVIGDQGNGTLTEVSGTATFKAGVDLAMLPGKSQAAPSMGFVNLTGGIFSAQKPSVIGDTGKGTFTQTGGTAQFIAPNTAAALIVGGDPSASPGNGQGGGTGVFTIGSSNSPATLVVEATNSKSKLVDGTVQIGSNGGTGVFNFNTAAGDAATLQDAGAAQGNADTPGAVFQVGVNGTGTLNQGGGLLTLADLQIATNTGTGTTMGTVSVAGSGSKLVTAALEVGALTASGGGAGKAGLTVSGGASLAVDAALAQPAGTATVLSFKDGAQVAADGVGTFQGSIAVRSGGSLEVGGHAGAAANTLQIDATGALVGYGLVDSDVTGTSKLAGGALVNAYSLAVIDNGGIEAKGGPLVIHGSVSGAGGLKIDANSTLELAGAVGAGETVTFNGAGATLIVDDPAAFKAAIAGFQLGDAVDFLHRPVSHDFSGAGQSDLLIENTGGVVVTGAVAGGQAAYTQVSGLGSEWSFHGTGDFLGDGKSDFLIENTAGAVAVGEISGGVASYTHVTSLGAEWKFVGAGDFLGDTRSDFLIENTAGAVYVGEVENGQANYTQVASLGAEWKFVGAGDYLGEGHDQFLIENTLGQVFVGDVGSNNQASYTQVASLGSEWTFKETGDFLGDGKSDFLIENTAGAVYVGEVVNGQAKYTQVAALGAEWKFVGAGDYLGEGHDQFLIENSLGQVDIGDFTGGQIHYTQVSGLGSEWAFH